MSVVGKGTVKQRSGRRIEPRTINQFRAFSEAFARLSGGNGIGQSDLAGFAPFLRLLGVESAIAKADPDGITAADWTDEDNVIAGQGYAIIYVNTSGNIGKPRGKPELVLNWYEGTVAANHRPLFLVKIDGVWHLNNFQCP